MSNKKSSLNENNLAVMSGCSRALRTVTAEADSGFARAGGGVLALCCGQLGADHAAVVEITGEQSRVIAAAESGEGVCDEAGLLEMVEPAISGWGAALIDGGAIDSASVLAQPFRLGDQPAGVVVFVWDKPRGEASSPQQVELIGACADWVSAEWSRLEEDRRQDELSEQRYRAMVKGAADGLFEWDLETNRVEYSAKWKQILGYGEQEKLHKPDAWLDLVESSDLAQLEADLAMCIAGQMSSLRNQHRVLTTDGQMKWMLCRIEPVFNEAGDPVRLIGSLSDTTEFKLAEEKLRHAAEHDKLTDLPNRAMLHARLEKAIRRHKLTGGRRQYALMFIDFDRFKVINDSLGHDAGDQLLIQISRRLGEQVRSIDTAARIGGDEFVILLEEIDDFDAAVRIADRLLDTFSRPFNLDGNEVTSTASIGLVEGTTEYTNAEDVIRDADSAMYHAKSLGKARYSIFDQNMQDESLKRLVLERELRQAVGTEQFYMAYQPIVSVEDASVVGFEALIRWQHPTLGLIRPDQFIDIAEDSGLIVPLGRWILERSCSGLKAIQQAIPDTPFTMNVNLSRRQLVQPDVVEMIQEVVDASGVDRSRIKLEITESVIMDNRAVITAVLEQLRELGFCLAMDDFGTGYSSLSCLHEFPIDVLKIDRSFVQSLDERIEFAAVIQAIVTLAHTLKMTVVAEGIETTEQLVVLQTLECDHLQGYLFARPLPLDEVISLLMRPAPNLLSA